VIASGMRSTSDGFGLEWVLLSTHSHTQHSFCPTLNLTTARSSVSLLRIFRISLALRNMDALAILPIQVSRGRSACVVPIEKHRHLLQCVSACFRIVEVDDYAHDEQYCQAMDSRAIGLMKVLKKIAAKAEHQVTVSPRERRL
jgi:hypothetical protein